MTVGKRCHFVICFIACVYTNVGNAFVVNPPVTLGAYRQVRPTLLWMADEEEENDDKKNKRLLTFEELRSDTELSRKEQEASQRRYNRLLLPGTIGKAITASAWTFIALGIILNMFGYGYVRKPGDFWVSIDTLEQRDFLLEMNKRP